MGPLLTDTVVTTLTKLGTCQKAKDNRLKELSKNLQERNTTLTKQLKIFRKNKHNSSRGVLLHNTAAKTQILQEVLTGDISKAVLEVTLGDSEDLDQVINNLHSRIRTEVHIRHDKNHIRTSCNKIQILSISRNLSDSNLRIKTFKKLF